MLMIGNVSIEIDGIVLNKQYYKNRPQLKQQLKLWNELIPHPFVAVVTVEFNEAEDALPIEEYCRRKRRQKSRW